MSSHVKESSGAASRVGAIERCKEIVSVGTEPSYCSDFCHPERYSAKDLAAFACERRSFAEYRSG